MHPIDWNIALLMLPLGGLSIALFAKTLRNSRVRDGLDFLAGIGGVVLPLVLLGPLYVVIKEKPWYPFVGQQPDLLGIQLSFDGLFWLLSLLGLIGSFLSWLYTRSTALKGPVFTALLCLQTFGLIATAASADLFNLFVCFEILGIASYVLVALAGKGRAFLASFSYMMVSSASMLFFLLGVFGLYKVTGRLSYSGISQVLAGGISAESVWMVRLSVICIVGATAVRIAVLPVYGWLPEAHASAPHGVSAVLSGVLIKVPLFALGRFLFTLQQDVPFLAPDVQRLTQILGTAGTFTSLVATVLSLCQRDAKLILAYSSISHIGYIVAAWSLASPLGFVVAYLHAFSHAMAKGILFLTVGTVSDRLGERNVDKARGGLSQGWFLFGAFLVGVLSLAALPPLGGWVSKGAVAELYKGGWQYTILFISSWGTMAAMLRLSQLFWHPFSGKSFFPSFLKKPFPALSSLEPVFPSSSGGASISGGKSASGEVSQDADASQGNGKQRLPRGTLFSITLYGLLCIASGVFAHPWISLVTSLLSPTPAAHEKGITIPQPSGSAFITIVAGALLFGLSRTRRGGQLLQLIRNRPQSFEGLVGAFSVAIGALAVLLFIP